MRQAYFLFSSCNILLQFRLYLCVSYENFGNKNRVTINLMLKWWVIILKGLFLAVIRIKNIGVVETMKKWLPALGLASALLLTACNEKEDQAFYGDVQNGLISHIHGLGFAEGGEELLVATHWGLYAYNEGWQESTEQKHDYMGFSITDDGFYSSGHPSVKSDLKNPLGLFKGTKQGAEIEEVAFYGEIDFHHVAASYSMDTLYVFNETPTEKLSGGLHKSDDNGETWQLKEMAGVEGAQIIQMAVHPTESETLAIAMDKGLFISSDSGQTFEKTSSDITTAVTYTEDGLYAAMLTENQPHVMHYKTNGEVEMISLPNEFVAGMITYMAVHPTNEQRMVMVTDNLTMYETQDGSKTWSVIATNGKVGDTENVPSSVDDKNQAHKHHSSSGELPEGLKVKDNPTFEIGDTATMQANHMPGMNGVKATISGAFDTTVYSVTYTSLEDGTVVRDHKWVIHEELQDAQEASYKIGDEVVLGADHMAGMNGATAVIEEAVQTTVYMVDFTAEDRSLIENHKWVTEEELVAN